MANQNLNNPSTVRAVVLIEFVYETPQTIERFAIAEDDITYNSFTFSALPEAEVELPKVNGTPEGTVAKIKMKETSLLSSMRSTFPPVTVHIYEIIPGDDTSIYKLYKGQILRASFNYNGNPGLVQVEIGGAKKRLETTVSIPLGRYCPWTFGEGPCKYDREASKDTATVTAINGNRVTLSGASTLSPTLFRYGTLRFNGFEVTIHKQDALDTIYTNKPVPQHWIGETVDILPGCGKTIDDCQTRGQESNFGAIGKEIPNRDIRVVP